MPMNTTLETRPGPPGTSPRASDRAPATHLLDDLGGGHVALEPALAGGAERAGHAAAGLAGDAHGDPVGVAHQHRLDERAVEQLPQGLAGGAAVGLQGAQRRHQRRQQRRDQLVALAGRQVGHLGRVVDQPGEVVRGELLGAERRAGPAPSASAGALVRRRGRRGGAAACRGPRGSSKTRGRVLRLASSVGTGIRSCVASTQVPQHQRADADHDDRGDDHPDQHVGAEPAGALAGDQPDRDDQRDQHEREQVLGACRRRRPGCSTPTNSRRDQRHEDQPGEEPGQGGERRVVAVPPAGLRARRRRRRRRSSPLRAVRARSDDSQARRRPARRCSSRRS